MRSRAWSTIRHKLLVGLWLRCPECEQGKLMKHHFRVEEKCPYCGVRFERAHGEAIGAVYINVAVGELTALTGFFIVHALTNMPIMHQLFIWIPYMLIFTVLFYPRARGLWISISYLMGEIYADMDYEYGEYIATEHRRRLDRAPHEHEDS